MTLKNVHTGSTPYHDYRGMVFMTQTFMAFIISATIQS